MSVITRLLCTNFQNTTEALINTNGSNLAFVRHASKRAPSNKGKTVTLRPKHRGWRVQDGHHVQAGTILVTQRTTRFHPGLHVGFGRNGTLFAMEPGKVVVTVEKIDPNWDHTWIQRNYEGSQERVIYKKHFNVIPEPQHKRFKLIDAI